MGRVRQNATYEDLIKAPGNMVAEIIDGDLYTWPRPAGPHTRVASVLGMDIGPPYDLGRGGPGGWWILDEPELHLGRHVLVPDIGGWRRERMPAIPQDQKFTIPPDWICEVISPSTGRVDREKKMPICAEHAVSHAWLVDPQKQSLEVKRLDDGVWTEIGLFTGRAKVRAEPFPEVEIDLAMLWPPTPV
jgi:Uma2 family endonuclease